MTSTAESSATGTEAKERPVTKFRKWLILTVGAGLATVIGGVIATASSQLDDVRRDIMNSEPLRVVVRQPSWEGEVGAMADVLNKGPDRFLLLRGATDEQWNDLIRRHKTAKVGYQNLIIVIQGQRHEVIRVIDVRPHIRAAGPVLHGTCIRIPTQGSTETFKIKADLDRLRPGGKAKNAAGTFLPKSVDLGEGDRMTVEMSVLAKRRFYEYDLEITYDYGGDPELRTMRVAQPDGEPFRVTGKAAKYTVGYSDPSIGGNAYRAIGRNRSC